ncbi:hypothetical protein KR044_003165 [Drosophila immigrans]|nr:hypothetical protein KR044_003165 [Drosophila immigrans]
MQNKLDDLLQLLNQELVDQFNEERQLLRAEAKRNIQKAQSNYKANFDKRRVAESAYKLGNLVAKKRTQFVAGRKLASKFLGPYRITNVKRNGRYDVEKTAANVKGPNVTSTSCDNIRLWRFVAENEDQDGRM